MNTVNTPIPFLSSQSQGNDVSRLQAMLLDLGFTIAPDELTSSFYGPTTRLAVAAIQRESDLPVTGNVNDVTAMAILRKLPDGHSRYRVLGTISYPNGRAGTKLTVRAFDRDLRHEQPLGEAQTDGQGFYEISYSREQFARAEEASADLFIRVFQGKKALYDPPIEATLFNAPALAVLNIVLAEDDTQPLVEFQLILSTVTPLLDGVPLDGLREDGQARDITFLAGETGIAGYKLAHFAVAQKLASAHKIPPDFFYALFAENTLIKSGLEGATGVRFDIDLGTELQPLFYDIVLLPVETVREAVQQAVADRFVTQDLLRRLDAILKQLGHYVPEAQAYLKEQRPKILFGHVVRFLAAGKHEEVIAILKEDTLGDLPGLFARLQQAAAFPDGTQADAAAAGVVLNSLLGYDRTILAHIQEAQGIQRPEDAARLAGLDEGEWRDLLRNAVAVVESKPGAATEAEVADKDGPPTPSPGPAMRDEVLDLHASALVRRMEKRFPTAAFAAHLQRDKTGFGEHRDAMLSVLESHPDLDLAHTNLDRMLKDHTAKEPLKGVQRVFKVAPTYRATKALTTGGIRSAAAISAMGETRFVKEFGKEGVLTPDEARAAFHKASDIHMASGLLAGEIQAGGAATKVSALMNRTPSDTVAKLEAVTQDFPNMKSLFQFADYCACMECNTVHSAAAYVADTLQFLKNRLVVDTTAGPGSVKIAKDVLFDRRPDLGDTDLNCDNTNTPLPYIDIVCELLEDAVAPDAGIAFNGAVASGVISPVLLLALQTHGFPFTEAAAVYDPDLSGSRIVRDKNVVCKLTPAGAGSWTIRRLRQTHGTAAERAAAPEYLNEAAYTTLAASEFAFSLPFDLFHQETRSYFAQFGIARADLMRALQTGAGPQDNQIAAEALGLSDEERHLIVTADPVNQNTYWNTGATPAANVLKVVDTFVTKAAIAFNDLKDLLDRAWVNPNGTMFVRSLDNTCDLAQKEIENLDSAALDRLHRFLRLWKKTGWTTTVIDRMTRAAKLGSGTLDDACLVRMQQVADLAGKLAISLDEACNLYDAIPTDGDASRYAQVFLNLAANGKIDPDFLPQNVHQNELDEAAVPGSGKKLAAYKDYLALCLGAKPADAGLLVDSLGAPAILSAANIGAVYALNLLARALRLIATDLLILIRLTGIDPLASPADTLRFLEKVDRVRASGVKPADLRYFLIHQADDLSAREVGDSTIGAFLLGLQSGYQALYADTRPAFDPAASPDENKNGVRTLLSKLPGFAEADLSRFQTLLDDSFQDPVLTPAQYIDQKLAAFVDTTSIKAAQATVAAAAPPKTAERNALIKAVLDAVSTYLYASGKEELLTTAVLGASRTFKLAEDLAPDVLRLARLKQPPAVGNRTLLDLLTDDALIDTVNTPPTPPAITPAAFDNQYRALRMLTVMAAFVGTLQLPREGVVWLLTNNAALGWLELDNLMYQAGIPPVTFAAWESLQQVLGLIAAYPPVANLPDPDHPFTVYGLFDLVLSGAAVGDVLAYLATLAGWDAAVLTDLNAQFNFALVDYRAPATYLRLGKAVPLLRRLGLSVASGVGVCKAILAEADALLMRGALKARYQDTEWLGVLQDVQDRLREQKRDALVAYLLVTNPDLKSSDDLYDYFLIDVEMSSCMPTSRIVQAHATIQLFVTRCLMGLEPRCVASIQEDSGWEQWKWMANFRVWEANRKIFLWPENWIDPELRDDKSEIFTSLENTLQQNELTDQAVEDAAVAYLERLDEIAQLEVMATYYQVDIRTMHVFARTKGGDPAVYYYRQFQQERYWTPWEKVDLDITGDHLLAFDRNSRLTLAWPIFTSEADDSNPPNTPNPANMPDDGTLSQKPNKRWKIQLAVSERSDGKWLPKKVSKGAIYDPATSYFDTEPPAPETYEFFEWNLGSAGQAVSCANVGESSWIGSFALTGCKGYPEPQQGGYFPLQFLPRFKDTEFLAERFDEEDKRATDDLAIKTIFNIGAFDTIVNQTPGLFKVTYPMQMSLIDWILFGLEIYLYGQYKYGLAEGRRYFVPLGTFMPYFYGDFTRTYVVIPGFYDMQAKDPKKRTEKMYSDIEQFVEDVVALFLKYLQKYQQDPAHDLNKLLQELAADPEFIRLETEMKVYMSLRFGLKFKNFYHPLMCFLRTTLNRQGLPALMQRDAQLKDTGFNFNAVYGPSGLVVPPYPREDIDFDRDGAYSAYNWELFFHIPFEIAMRLNQDQRFEQARNWLHYVFNPVGATDAPAPQRYWITKPFFQTTITDYLAQRINDILNTIAADPTGATITDLKFAVSEWRSKPFQPHVIARSRPVAYQLAIVTKYIQNLIDWGDSLFRQFTRESVTQATQMYIQADKLLGPKPRIVEPAVTPPDETYNQLESKLDLFGNALLDLENMIPDLALLPHGGAELPPAPITVSSLYFCIPANENLLQNWETVADRLLKIRNCQNIDGVEAVLALFSPPIDPGALVRAAAAGLDISAFLAGLRAPLPNYRFSVMSQKATELVQQVASLGNSLLTALEKRDGEQLARLHSEQELSVLNAVRLVKLATIDEANSTIQGLQKSRLVTQERRNYYASQAFMNPWEITAVALSGASLIGEAAIAVGYILAGGLKLIPDFVVGAAGFGGSPEVTASIGGQTIGNSAEMAAQVISSITRALDKAAGMASTQGSYQRRQDEWDFQVRLADKELAQIDQQIATANFHITMLNADLAAHDQQIANNKQTDAFLHSKYTNQELYDWMVGQVSAVYFQAYKLALEVAKKAERCFQHELGNDTTFLRPAYWDNLKKGLMIAEALHHDIKRMEVAYLDQNKREYELTKHISLAQLDPFALVQLKNTGKCTFQIPEALFDLDHPGQYFRRNKSISLSIPCVAGPYTTVSCKLSLVTNRYRKNTTQHSGTSEQKYQETPGSDERFVYNVGTIQSISTSSSLSDSGMFDLNFHDDRYLPFEGTGAIGTWQLEMPAVFPQFDYDTISDVILHMRYTARDGGSAFKALVEDALKGLLNDMVLAATRQGLFQAFNLKHDHSNEWHRLKQTNSTQLTLTIDNLPYFVSNHTPTVDQVTWMARVNGNPAMFVMSIDGTPFNLNADDSLNKLCTGSSGAITLGTPFTLSTTNATDLEDLVVLVHYTITA